MSEHFHSVRQRPIPWLMVALGPFAPLFITPIALLVMLGACVALAFVMHTRVATRIVTARGCAVVSYVIGMSIYLHRYPEEAERIRRENEQRES